MTNEAIITALGGALTAVAGAVFAFLKWYLPWKVKTKNLPQVVTDIGAIYDILQEYRVKLSAQRVFVVKAHNGGGPMKVTSPLYSTVLYEAYDEDVDPIKPGWQAQPSDAQYIQATIQLSKHGRLRMDLCGMGPSDMPVFESDKEGILVVAKEAGDTLFSDAFGLHTSKAGYYYLVVDMGHIPENMAEYQNEVRALNARIKKAMWPSRKTA